MMETAEFFSGSGILSEEFRLRGHKTLTIDNNPQLKADIQKDIILLSLSELPYKPQVMWFSISCTTFSVASIGKHWTGGKGGYIPKSKECIEGLKLLDKTVSFIAEGKPSIWFIENPRGVMRKVINGFFRKHGITDHKRYTTSYCGRYGEKRMKPTDIWSNIELNLKPICKNGDDCHEAVPRGSRTGTQGLKGAFERGKLPRPLCKEIVLACENKILLKEKQLVLVS